MRGGYDVSGQAKDAPASGSPIHHGGRGDTEARRKPKACRRDDGIKKIRIERGGKWDVTLLGAVGFESD